jgi:hypothetical protein
VRGARDADTVVDAQVAGNVQHRLWRIRTNTDAAISANAHFFRWRWPASEETDITRLM